MVTSRILGADGRPIRIGELAEPQTSRVGFLHQEWQGHPARGLTPSKLSSLLLAAEQGDLIGQYELYEDMEERDGHILSEMSKRRRAVSGLSWSIVPPPNASAKEKRDAEELQALIESIDDIEGIFFDTTDAVGKGFANQEIEWHKLGKDWLPKTITHRPQSWFRLYRGFQQEIRLRDNSSDGAPLQPFGWIAHTHRARSGYLERANLFRTLVWPYLFKNYSVADLAEFLEIYGIPLRIGKYPPGASDKEKTTLLRALVSIGHNAAGIIPDGMTLDFPTIAEGDPGAFQLMMDWCERTQSKVILGATLTSQADRGSNTNALGNVHNEVRKELKDSDAKQVQGTLSRDLVYPIAALNGLAPQGYLRCPRLVFDIAENKDIGVFATALPALVKLGMRIKRSWAHEELGIPEAEDDADLLVHVEPPSPVPPTPEDQAKAAELQRQRLATATARTTTLDPPALMTSQLARNVTVPAEWIAQIRNLVANAATLEEIRDGLLELHPEMSLDQYADAMSIALGAAHLAGRSEIQDENRGVDS